jgi:hypothetical protein
MTLSKCVYDKVTKDICSKFTSTSCRGDDHAIPRNAPGTADAKNLRETPHSVNIYSIKYDSIDFLLIVHFQINVIFQTVIKNIITFQITGIELSSIWNKPAKILG